MDFELYCFNIFYWTLNCIVLTRFICTVLYCFYISCISRCFPIFPTSHSPRCCFLFHHTLTLFDSGTISSVTKSTYSRYASKCNLQAMNMSLVLLHCWEIVGTGQMNILKPGMHFFLFLLYPNKKANFGNVCDLNLYVSWV